MSGISGSLNRRTRGFNTVPVTATPTVCSRFGRVAMMSSRGFSATPVNVSSPRSMLSFWP